MSDVNRNPVKAAEEKYKALLIAHYRSGTPTEKDWELLGRAFVFAIWGWQGPDGWALSDPAVAEAAQKVLAAARGELF